MKQVYQRLKVMGSKADVEEFFNFITNVEQAISFNNIANYSQSNIEAIRVGRRAKFDDILSDFDLDYIMEYRDFLFDLNVDDGSSLSLLEKILYNQNREEFFDYYINSKSLSDCLVANRCAKESGVEQKIVRKGCSLYFNTYYSSFRYPFTAISKRFPKLKFVLCLYNTLFEFFEVCLISRGHYKSGKMIEPMSCKFLKEIKENLDVIT